MEASDFFTRFLVLVNDICIWYNELGKGVIFMIYTVTLNPAIDYVMQVDEVCLGSIMRSNSESVHFGGKGINASLVLAELGVSSVATGFVAGFTGKALELGIKSEYLIPDFARLENGMTRINVKLRSGLETDINCKGPEVSGEDIDRLMGKLDKLTEGDTLILAGSVPPSMPSDIYEQILSCVSGRGVRFVVDAERDFLLSTLKFKPFLIKPNANELGAIFGIVIDSVESALEYASKLQILGAQNVLVSLGDMGAVLLDSEGKVHISSAPKGDAVNTVGAGDSMVAGFMAGYMQSGDYDHALRLGIAAGAATAFSVGLATGEKISEVLKRL